MGPKSKFVFILSLKEKSSTPGRMDTRGRELKPEINKETKGAWLL